jgi:hypothetical protein
LALFVALCAIRYQAVSSAGLENSRSAAWILPNLPSCKRIRNARPEISMSSRKRPRKSTQKSSDIGQEMWVQTFLHDLHRKSKLFGRNYVRLKIKGDQQPSWRAANHLMKER